MRFQTTTTLVCCRPSSSVVINCRQIPALAPLLTFHKAYKRNVASRTPRTRLRSSAGLSIPRDGWNYPGNNVRSLNRTVCPRAHHQESDVNAGLKVMDINRSVTRQIWRGDNPGNISDLKLETDELGAPASREVQVAVKAVGLNFADVFMCLGLYSASPKGVYTPGLEFAGVVAVGENVEGVEVGDRVLGLTRFGAYASHINVSPKYLHSFPSDWSFTEQCISSSELGNVQEGQTVLVHSAAGGCGTFALDICKQLKVKVVATVGSDEKVKYLVDYWGGDFLPYEQIIVRKGGGKIFKDQLAASLSTLRVDGFDCIIDAVAGDYFNPGYESLTRGGRHVVYGASSFTPTGNKPNWISLAWKYLRRPVVDPMEMMSDNKSVMAFNLIWMFDKVEKMERLLEGLQRLNLRPPVVPHLYCIGDANGKLMLAHAASAQGISVIEQVSGRDNVLNHNSIPAACFTHPEISMVGLTEPQARGLAEKEGFKVSIAKTSFKANTKALAKKEGDGIAKLIY